MPRCIRCGDVCRAGQSEPSNARPFRKAKRGRCAPCVVCAFFQDDGENGIGFALPPGFDPQGLKLPHIQEQFAKVLTMGNSELTMEQIDWDEVIRKWNIGAKI